MIQKLHMSLISTSYKSIIICIAFLATCLTAGAQTGRVEKHVEPLITTKIGLLTRTYGDSIVLRWSAEDFASWQYLCDVGVNILRVPKGAPGDAADDDAPLPPLQIDTLAYALKPLTLEQFQQRFPEGDSLALVCMGVIYGDTENEKHEREGSMGRTIEYNSEQDVAYGFAMMVAEWRKDLAEAMAVRFTDSTAVAGMTYDYYIQPTVWDNGGMLIFEPGVAEDVVNKPYSPKPYVTHITDSVAPHKRLLLRWRDQEHSSFEVERRLLQDMEGNNIEGLWERITTKPYASMITEPGYEDMCAITDSVPMHGVWEYRIMGYDAFADLSRPSTAHRVVIYDKDPPAAPELKYIVIERPEEDPMATVKAHVVWQKRELEPDLVGYCINYTNAQLTGGEWRTLNDEMIQPTDTVYTIDATNLITGMLCISAFDESGNESRSLMQQIRLTDYKAPVAPDSLRAEIVMPNPDSLAAMNQKHAYAILRWKPLPDDDIQYYDIAFANDSTHQFIIRNEGGIHETSFVDSLALNANQKYVYYKVRAVDYSTNIGPWSHWIQVKRPHVTPPTQPHLDKSSHSDETGMHMEWIVGSDADMEYHIAYRRIGDEGVWEVIGRYDADSLMSKGYRITIDDNPTFDRERRYYYYVESFNASPFSSSSLAVSWLHKGPKVWEVPIELVGDYIEKENRTRLVWIPGKLPFDAPYYWCIYRKGQGDDKFQFVISQPAKETEYTDEMLEKGQEAEYYVMIQWRDGRQSTKSNVIKVKRK